MQSADVLASKLSLDLIHPGVEPGAAGELRWTDGDFGRTPAAPQLLRNLVS
jgi:hypothetical protein